MGTNYAHGAWAEATAAAWLVRQGFEVFVGLSGQESFDMIATRRGSPEVLRVEVKYGARTPSGKLHCSVKDTTRYDTLLVVDPDGVVWQDPGPDICTGIGGPGRGTVNGNKSHPGPRPRARYFS